MTFKDKIIKICDYIIEYGFLAIIFFIPIIFDFTISSYNWVDLYKIVAFRVILTLALLAYVAKIFISGKLSYRGSNKIFLFTAFLALSFFTSSLFSIHPDESFWGSFYRQQGFYNFFHYLLFFALLILNIKEFKQIRRIIMAVIVSASLISIYGLAQYFNLDPVNLNGGYLNTSRFASTLGQPNFFGHYLILVLPFSLYALIFMAKRFWLRFFISLAILAQLFCLIFTYSRAAWLGFLGSIALLLLAWLVSRRFKKIALGLIGLILIVPMAIIGLNIIRPASQSLYETNLVNRIKSIVDFNGGSNKMRLYYLEISLKEMKKESYGRLLVGYGPETLKSVFIKYYQPDWGVYEAINTMPDRAHNWLFDQILALGFFGLMANLAFYIYLIYKATAFLFARQKFGSDGWLLIFLFSSLVAYCINNLFSFSLFTVSVYLYLILAISWLVINYQAKGKEITIKLTFFSKLLIWLSLLSVSAIFIYTNNVNQVGAEIHYMKSLRSMKISICPDAMNQMEKAVSLRPNSDYYRANYVFLMLDCFPRVKDMAAREQLRDSIFEQLESINNKETYDVLNITARAYALFGFYLDKTYYEKADKIFNGLIVDFPYLTAAYEELGKQRMMQEDYGGVIDIYKGALEILPSMDHPYLNDQHRAQIALIAVRLYENIGQSYLKIKNYDLANVYYKKALSLDPYRATSYKGLADIYYLQGQLDQAIVLNKRGLILNPADYHWPLALSLLYRDKKDLTKAREYLDQALKLAPENQDLKNYYQELKK